MDVEKRELTDEQFNETITLANEYNNKEFNALKLAEEAMELAELLIKSVTKAEHLRPSRAAIVEELGDFMCRTALYVGHDEELQDAIEERCESKMALLYDRFKEGTMGTQVGVFKKKA